MKIKILLGSATAVALVALGVLAGSVAGAGGVSAQTSTPPAQATPAKPAQPAPSSPGTTTTAKVTQQQAEQAALAAAPGSTVDHSSLGNQNGTAIWDVDFTNGGGVVINADTGAVISVEAAGADKGGGGGPRGGGGADQAALATQAKVTQQQAEQAAVAAAPGSTVDHSRLGNDNGTIFWDVDFSNGGGVKVNAITGAVITVEAAGTDHPGGHFGGRGGPGSPAPNGTPTP